MSPGVALASWSAVVLYRFLAFAESVEALEALDGSKSATNSALTYSARPIKLSVIHERSL